MTEPQAHEVWMALNCGEPDGGCSCGHRCPDGSGWLQIGMDLGAHMFEALRR